MEPANPNHTEPATTVFTIAAAACGWAIRFISTGDTEVIQPLTHLLLLFVTLLAFISGAYSVSPRFKKWFISKFKL